MSAASCKRSKTPRNIPQFVFWRHCSNRVKLLPTWVCSSAFTESGFSPPIILCGFCMLGSKVLLVVRGSEPVLTQHQNWLNWTLTQVQAVDELWSRDGQKPELALCSWQGPIAAAMLWATRRVMKDRESISEVEEDASTLPACRTAENTALETSHKETHGDSCRAWNFFHLHPCRLPGDLGISPEERKGELVKWDRERL